MATLTIEIPDDLMDRLNPLRDQLPDLLRRCLQPSALSVDVYCHILDFLASQPTPEQISAFRPTPAIQDRFKFLLLRNSEGNLSPEESQELDAYGQIEHLIVLLKSGNLPYLVPVSQS